MKKRYYFSIVNPETNEIVYKVEVPEPSSAMLSPDCMFFYLSENFDYIPDKAQYFLWNYISQDMYDKKIDDLNESSAFLLSFHLYKYFDKFVFISDGYLKDHELKAKNPVIRFYSEIN